MIAQHSSATNEHPTPAHVVELARRVLGMIDLDPASCAEFNETVKARAWYGPTHPLEYLREGLAPSIDWRGRVFCNPPGGTLKDRRDVSRWGTKSSACAWWRKLTECASRDLTEAVFIGFTLELLRSAQSPGQWPHPFDFTVCVPRERLCFCGDDPTHANVIVYVGPNAERFETVFSEIGRCK